MTAKKSRAGFTVVELLVVMAIILVLAGLILATSGYVQKKGARSRAEAEIAAMSAACESYKADNGIYPSSLALDARINLLADTADKAAYETSSQTLYVALTGDANRNRTQDSGETGKSYFSFKPNMLSPIDQTSQVTAIRDPFGNSYGYSTVYSSDSSKGYNPTFDLWSTANSGDPNQWIKNW